MERSCWERWPASLASTGSRCATFCERWASNCSFSRPRVRRLSRTVNGPHPTRLAYPPFSEIPDFSSVSRRKLNFELSGLGVVRHKVLMPVSAGERFSPVNTVVLLSTESHNLPQSIYNERLRFRSYPYPWWHRRVSLAKSGTASGVSVSRHGRKWLSPTNAQNHDTNNTEVPCSFPRCADGVLRFRGHRRVCRYGCCG